ncbi:MAG: hypothetical protein FWF51_09895 [Chitinivibrionia bacterium]|nr:hypothetical protein [Chitinivibrionia bacterium]
MKKFNFFKVLLCVVFLLTTNLYSQSESEGRKIRNEIKKLEGIFLNTDENDYQKLAETSRKLSYYYAQRKYRNNAIIAATWYFRIPISNITVAKHCGRKAKHYNDLYKFYAMELYYSSEGKYFSENLTYPPIMYNSGKRNTSFSD